MDAVIIGDAELGSWNVLENHMPQVIALGHDQDKLKDALEKYFEDSDWKFEIVIMKKFS